MTPLAPCHLAQSVVLPDATAWRRQTYRDFSGREDIRAYGDDRPTMALFPLRSFKSTQ
jgi:hypothetical protein